MSDRARIFKPEAFLEWAERQNPNDEYDYYDNCGCAYQQYLSSIMPYAKVYVNVNYYTIDGKEHEMPAYLDNAVFRNPHNYGALAKRLEKIVKRSEQQREQRYAFPMFMFY